MNELDKIWNSADSQINQNTSFSIENLSVKDRKKLQGKLYQIPINYLFNIIIAIPFSLFLIDFIKAYIHELNFAFPAAILLLCVLFSLALSLYALSEYFKISVDDNIVKTQKRLTSLSILEKWETRSLLVIIPLIAGPFLIVFAKYLLNIDLLEWAGQWIFQFIGGSFLVALIIVFLLSRFPNPHLKAARQHLRELNELGE